MQLTFSNLRVKYVPSPEWSFIDDEPVESVTDRNVELPADVYISVLANGSIGVLINGNVEEAIVGIGEVLINGNVEEATVGGGVTIARHGPPWQPTPQYSSL